MGDACDQVAQIHDDGCRGHEFLRLRLLVTFLYDSSWILDSFSVFGLDEFVSYEFIDWVGFGGGDIEFHLIGEHINSCWLSPSAFVKNLSYDFCLSGFDK
jgi:hypothetical protein